MSDGDREILLMKGVADEFDGLDGLEWPIPRGCPFGPPAAYERLRERARITKIQLVSGGGAWRDGAKRSEGWYRRHQCPRKPGAGNKPGIGSRCGVVVAN